MNTLDTLKQMHDTLWEEEWNLRDKYIDMCYALDMDPSTFWETQDIKDIKHKAIVIWTAIQEIEKIEKGGK